MRSLRSLIPIFLIILSGVIVYAEKTDEEISNTGNPERDESRRDFYRADHKLNVIYKMVIKAYGDDEEGENAKERLKSAQLAWIKYRDLEAVSQVYYPMGITGTAAVTWAKAELTKERTERLKNRLDQRYKEMIWQDQVSKQHDKLTDSIKQMLDEIKRMEANERKITDK